MSQENALQALAQVERQIKKLRDRAVTKDGITARDFYISFMGIQQTMTIAEESAWDDCMRHRGDQPAEAAMPVRGTHEGE